MFWYCRALEILQDINCSLNRKNKFSELALQRLLDSNLSVKYSLTGHLFSTDITTDGFYDPGQVYKELFVHIQWIFPEAVRLLNTLLPPSAQLG